MADHGRVPMEFSFMDFLQAPTPAAGLGLGRASSSRSIARPPPDNFFRLPSDPGEWRKVHELWQKENMVAALEFTDDNFPQEQREFMDLARDFDSIPFLRVEISPGETFDKLREDLGGVVFVPTFLAVFFGDGKICRAKYEHPQAIRETLESGRFREIIKEFIERRVKLKAANRRASNLPEHVNSQTENHKYSITNGKEQRVRQECRMKRQMTDRDSQLKTQEQGKEEEEHKKQDRQKMLDNERRKQAARPQHIAQLKKLDLKTAPIRQIKTIMQEMGIDMRGCIERGELVERLMDCCPELRLSQKQPQRAPVSAEDATPSHWDGMPLDPTTQYEAVVHKADLPESCSEYKRVVDSFNKTAVEGKDYSKIVAVKRIQRPFLYKQYMLKKQEMDRENPSDIVNERQLFHGTSKEALEAIIHNNFDRVFAGTAVGARYGRGSYFAVDAKYSIGYSKPDNDGNCYMCLVRVLTGEYTKGTSGMMQPPPKDPNNPHKLFDSTVNDEQTPKIFVVFKDPQAYPEYLIIFRK